MKKRPDRYVPLDNTAPAAPRTAADVAVFAAGGLGGPVASVVTDIAVLKSELAPVLSPEQRSALDRAAVSAARLASSVAIVAVVAQSDTARLIPDIGEVRLDDVYGGVSADLARRALTGKRLLGIGFPHDLPAVAADGALIGQVFAAVVDNAVLNSRMGGQVTVGAAVDGDMVRVTVTDHGDGIASRDLDSLFTKFFRTDASRSLYPGLGLGLYASRLIIERHGGRITVASHPGEGTAVSFTLPVARAHGQHDDTIVEY